MERDNAARLASGLVGLIHPKATRVILTDPADGNARARGPCSISRSKFLKRSEFVRIKAIAGCLVIAGLCPSVGKADWNFTPQEFGKRFNAAAATLPLDGVPLLEETGACGRDGCKYFFREWMFTVAMEPGRFARIDADYRIDKIGPDPMDDMKAIMLVIETMLDDKGSLPKHQEINANLLKNLPLRKLQIYNDTDGTLYAAERVPNGLSFGVNGPDPEDGQDDK